MQIPVGSRSSYVPYGGVPLHVLQPRAQQNAQQSPQPVHVQLRPSSQVCPTSLPQHGAYSGGLPCNVPTPLSRPQAQPSSPTTPLTQHFKQIPTQYPPLGTLVQLAGSRGCYTRGIETKPQSSSLPASRSPASVEKLVEPWSVGKSEVELCEDDDIPEWVQLSSRCDEVTERTNGLRVPVDLVGIGVGDLENGSTNPFAKVRLFGASESDVRLTVYRDSNGWCGFCQKVWLYVEEKRIPYRVEKANLRCYGEKPPWLTKLNPKGLLPVVMLDGKILVESKEIMLALESEFPQPPLVDRRPAAKMRADNLYSLSTQLSSAFFTSLLGYGPQSAFETKLDEFNRELQMVNGPFLFEEFSLADIHFIPFLERARACLLYAKGLNVRSRPRWAAVDRWFEAMEQRDTYVGTQSDFFNLVHFIPPQVGWFALEGNPTSFIASIDGTDGSWCLPLPQADFERSPTSEDGALEAALKLVLNHDRLIGFAKRTGPLEHEQTIDAALRMTAALLLDCLGSSDATLALPRIYFGASQQRAEAARSCRYIRDRVGVPRDMRLGAARHLRGALNSVIERLGFSTFEKDLRTAQGGGLTFAPKDSVPADDLRSLIATEALGA